MSKREFERKHREEQEATAHAFQEFIQTFQDNSTPPSKLFVKSGILYAKDKETDPEKGKIYNPKPLVRAGGTDTIKKAIECARLLKENRIERQKGNEKPKSNLELLKEELRIRHLERDIRMKNRNDIMDNMNLSCYESDDQTTTNLFVANINPNITEQHLMQIFGVYGPLASVKIMWPRGDDKGRNNNVGFVAFMSRRDGERALESLKNRDDMRIGWGKPVEIPSHPVYIPPELLKLLLPPPQSGLPFNAQPKGQVLVKTENLDKILYDSVVNVTVPLEKKNLCLIHRVIEFVVREGPLFEAMIMNKEINNPLYQFLFDNKSPHHTYYRWKLYSILNGEGVYSWSNKQFRMFKGGSIWIPPVLPDYTQGMPDEFARIEKTDRKMLSQAQRNRLIHSIQNLNVNRLKIGEAMVFCMNHEEAARDVVNLLKESFENDSTNPGKKMARLFLVSDILYNSGVKKVNKSRKFVSEFENNLLHIFGMLERCCHNLKSAHEKDAFKVRVLKVIRSWDLWKIYQSDYLKEIEQKFLKQSEMIDTGDDSAADEPLDGKNLIKRSLQNNFENNGSNSNVTIVDDIRTRRNAQPNLSDFIPSKWESVKPEDIEAQAMSTKKIYDLELERQRNVEKQQKRLSEEQRELLRKIEVLVMQYQDELEAGKRKRKRGRSMDEEILHYRKSLINKYKHRGHAVQTSPISSDSLSSDDERREYNRRKKYKRRDRRDKERHGKHYKN